MSIQLHQSAVGKLIAKRGSRSARLGKRDLLGGEGRMNVRTEGENRGRERRSFRFSRRASDLSACRGQFRLAADIQLKFAHAEMDLVVDDG